MNNAGHGIFSIWKLIGLFIAIGAFGYKIYYTIVYFNSISDWWGGLIILFFAMYLTNIATVLTSFTRSQLTLILALTVITISMTLICLDGLVFLGFAASLDSTPMIKRGIFPLAHILNSLAGVFDLIGYFSIRRRSVPKR